LVTTYIILHGVTVHNTVKQIYFIKTPEASVSFPPTENVEFYFSEKEVSLNGNSRNT